MTIRHLGIPTVLLTALALVVATCANAIGTPTFQYAWGERGSGPGQFWYPTGIVIDASGNVYVSDLGNHRVQKFTNAGEYLLQWGTEGELDGQFGGLYGISVDPLGNVYTAESLPGRIQKFTSAGAFITRWRNHPEAPDYLDTPIGVASGGPSSDRFHVVSQGGGCLQVYDASGTFMWGNGPRLSTTPTVYLPSGVAVAPSGDVFVCQMGLVEAICRFSPEGALLGTFGDDLSWFDAVAVGPNGNVVVVNTARAFVRIYSPAGSLLEQWDIHGSGDGHLAGPVSVAVDPNGKVFVVDASQKRVHVFTSSQTPVSPTTWSTIKGIGSGR